MAITRNRNEEIIFSCEECGDTIETPNKVFSEALDHAKAGGWRVQKRQGEFSHFCPGC